MEEFFSEKGGVEGVEISFHSVDKILENCFFPQRVIHRLLKKNLSLDEWNPSDLSFPWFLFLSDILNNIVNAQL